MQHHNGTDKRWQQYEMRYNRWKETSQGTIRRTMETSRFQFLVSSELINKHQKWIGAECTALRIGSM